MYVTLVLRETSVTCVRGLARPGAQTPLAYAKGECVRRHGERPGWIWHKEGGAPANGI